MTDRLLTPVEVAQTLGTTSRQVHTWSTRRDTNGFPEPAEHQVVRGRTMPVYDVTDVLAWWVAYDATANRGAHWAAKPPRHRRLGPCEVCGRTADVKVADGDPIVHGRCRRTPPE